MDFFDNVVKSSNALIKERLNNPFGNKQQATNNKQDDHHQQPSEASSAVAGNTGDNQQATTSSGSSIQKQTPSSSQTSPLDETATSNDQQNGDKNSQFAAIAADAEAVAQKAAKGAKTFGTFLFSMANKAGQTVTQTAKQVKQAVENTSILTDFTREQQEFIKEHGGALQAGELPWEDCKDETKAAEIREQILSLSQDKRNFVRSPPNDSSFKFDPQKGYPIALSLLKEDPNLGKMRFELVPKLVNEDTFWCNYFYRVSLLRQMSEKGENFKRGWASSRSSSGEGPDEVNDEANQNEGPLSPSYSTSAAPDHQQSFTSDPSSTATVNTTTSPMTIPNTTSYQTQELESSESRKLVAEADDLKSKLKELNIGSLDDGGDQDENDKWEEELQRDLQEFELVSGGDVSTLDEEALDKDILELKKASKVTK